VASLAFGLHFGQDQIMTGRLFRCSIYVQILSGRLALMIENFKAYFLAYPKICKAGLPNPPRNEQKRPFRRPFGENCSLLSS